MKQMTLEEISKAAASGAFRKIPVSREIYSDIRTPVETLKVLQGVSSHCYMLESVEDKKQWGRYTFLGYDPSLELTCVNGNLTITADAAEMKKVEDIPESHEEQLPTGQIRMTAKTDHPVKQGLMGAFEVFADTIVVCSMTGLVVIVTGYWNSGLQGSELTLTAFESGMGSVARALIALSIFLFGLTTSTGWFTYYSVILKHWLKNNQKVFKIAEKVFILGTPLWGLLVTVLTLYGNGTPAQLWVIADFTTVFPTFVNVATLFILSGTFIKLLKDYKARYLGIGKVDEDMALFYEDKKAKEEK